LNIESVSHLTAHLNIWVSRSTEGETNDLMIPGYEPCSKQPGVEPAREWNNDRPTIGDLLEPIECGLESGL